MLIAARSSDDLVCCARATESARPKYVSAFTTSLDRRMKRRALAWASEATLWFRRIRPRMLQVADYCAWAVFRKWEHGKPDFFEHIKYKVKSEFDLWKYGGALQY
jgi:hypothetical protein